MPDQRRSTRKLLKVQFRGSDGEGIGQLVWEGADLSAGGTFLVSDLLLEPEETLLLEFRLPAEQAAIRAEAKVAWVRRFPKDGEQPGMGVRFVKMSPDDRAALEKFVGE
jgi:uncharacterized protein (TIGR02266 family)